MTYLIACAVRLLPLAVAAAIVGWRLRSARESLRIWTGLLYAALAMPLLTAALPPLRVPLLHAPTPAAFTIPAGTLPPAAAMAAPSNIRRASGVGLPATLSGPQRPVPTARGASPTTPAPLAPRAAGANGGRSARIFPIAPASLLFPGLYLAVAAFLFFRLAVGMWIAHRLQARATSATVAGHAVLVSELIAVPISVGLMRPAIVLPPSWRSWPAATLHAVLSHEAAHIARGDTRTQWLARVHRALFWFNPLSWWLAGKITELAELASDEAALEAGAEPGAYAQAVLAFFAQLAGEPGRVWWRGVAMARGGSPQHRINRILAWERGTVMKSNNRIAIVMLSVAVLAAVTLAAVVTPVARTARKTPRPAIATPQTSPAQPTNADGTGVAPQGSRDQNAIAQPAPVAAAPVQQPAATPAAACPALESQPRPAQAVQAATSGAAANSPDNYTWYAYFAPGAFVSMADQPRLSRFPDGSFVYTGRDSAHDAYLCVAAVAGYSVQFDPNFDGATPLTLDFRGFTVPEAFDSLARASGSSWKMADAKTVAVKALKQKPQAATPSAPIPPYSFTVYVPPAPPAPPPAAVSAEQYRDRRLLVIYFDFTTMAPADIQSGVDSAEAYVNKQMQASDLVAIAALGSALQVVADFTADKEVLIRDLESLRPNASGTPAPNLQSFIVDSADSANIADRSLEALTAISEMLAPIQQRKSLLYISDGIPRAGSDNEMTLRTAVNAAVRANLSIYTMDARGLMAQTPPEAPLPPAPESKPPVPLSMPGPAMPAAGVAPGQSRTVTVHIAIGADGHVSSARTDDSASDEFDRNAVAAAMNWLFQPATQNGQPVGVSADVRVVYWQH